MFGSIKNLIKGLIHLPRIIQNPVSYTLWWFLLPILAIPAALAIIVEFFARDLVKLLIFGGDEFDVTKLPETFKIISIIAGVLATIAFIFYFVFILVNPDSRRKIKESIKGIITAVIFIIIMPFAFFLLQYVVTVLFDLLKLAFGLQNQSVSETIIKQILKTGLSQPENPEMKFESIKINMEIDIFLNWVEYINPILPLITAFLVTWTYIQFSIAILWKSMELFSMFVASPIYAVYSVFDGRKIYRKYLREKIIGKSFAVLGLMFIFNVSFLFLDYFTNRLLDPIVASILSSGRVGHISNLGSGIIKGLVTLVAIVASATFVSKGANLFGDLIGESINIYSPASVLKFAGKVTTAGASAISKRFKKNSSNTNSLTDTSTSNSTSKSHSSTQSSSTTNKSFSNKVEKTKTSSRNTSGILKGESTIAFLNKEKNNSSSTSSSTFDQNTQFVRSKSPSTFKKTEEFAKANNVDLSNVTGTGKNGRILKSDVLNAINQQKQPKVMSESNYQSQNNQKSIFEKIGDNSIVDKLEPKQAKQNKNQVNQKTEEDKKRSTFEEFKKTYKNISEIQDRKLMIQELKKLSESLTKFSSELKKDKKVSNSESLNNQKAVLEIKQINSSIEDKQKIFRLNIFKAKDKGVEK
ncbi:Mbov_0396 family ICE element transmembrane protein [Mycoplasma capricolum]|uniref:Mbov_0396 family ICE element transmembrane protein n=1 Tax=Mycoplasma capricolum TaxID=2095 RepID=UPI003DA3B455